MHLEKKNLPAKQHIISPIDGTERQKEVCGLRWSVGGGWQQGKGVRTPAERGIRFEGGSNWLHTMGNQSISFK